MLRKTSKFWSLRCQIKPASIRHTDKPRNSILYLMSSILILAIRVHKLIYIVLRCPKLHGAPPIQSNWTCVSFPLVEVIFHILSLRSSLPCLSSLLPEIGGEAIAGSDESKRALLPHIAVYSLRDTHTLIYFNSTTLVYKIIPVNCECSAVYLCNEKW